MKKFLLILFAVVFTTLSMVAAAPTGSHAEFMGIPIDYDIDTFGQKLSAKGFKYTDNSTSDEMRSYAGGYNGRDVEIFVTFDSASRIVYGFSMFIPVNESEKADELAVDLAVKLWEEYGDKCLVLDEETDSEDAVEFDLYNTNKDFIGTLSIEVTDIVGDTYVMLSIFDAINAVKAKGK